MLHNKFTNLFYNLLRWLILISTNITFAKTIAQIIFIIHQSQPTASTIMKKFEKSATSLDL